MACQMFRQSSPLRGNCGVVFSQIVILATKGHYGHLGSGHYPLIYPVPKGTMDTLVYLDLPCPRLRQILRLSVSSLEQFFGLITGPRQNGIANTQAQGPTKSNQASA